MEHWECSLYPNRIMTSFSPIDFDQWLVIEAPHSQLSHWKIRIEELTFDNRFICDLEGSSAQQLENFGAVGSLRA